MVILLLTLLTYSLLEMQFNVKWTIWTTLGIGIVFYVSSIHFLAPHICTLHLCNSSRKKFHLCRSRSPLLPAIQSEAVGAPWQGVQRFETKREERFDLPWLMPAPITPTDNSHQVSVPQVFLTPLTTKAPNIVTTALFRPDCWLNHRFTRTGLYECTLGSRNWDNCWSHYQLS